MVPYVSIFLFYTTVQHQGSIEDFLFGREVDPKKMFGTTQGLEKIF